MIDQILAIYRYLWAPSVFLLPIFLLAWQRVTASAVEAAPEEAVRDGAVAASQIVLIVVLTPALAPVLDATPIWQDEWFVGGIDVWAGVATFGFVSMVPIGRRSLPLSFSVLLAIVVMVAFGRALLGRVMFPALQFYPPAGYAEGVSLLACSLVIWARWGGLQLAYAVRIKAQHARPLHSLPALVRVGGLQYDVFISHASEDKDAIVRPLADELDRRKLSVWYDEFELRIGDRLVERIDEGLRASRVAVVIVSEAFFEKAWAGHELGGIVELALAGEQRLLPIWHGVTKRDVLRFSPTLAGVVARNTQDKSISAIAAEIADLIQVGGAPGSPHETELGDNGPEETPSSPETR